MASHSDSSVTVRAARLRARCSSFLKVGGEGAGWGSAIRLMPYAWRLAIFEAWTAKWTCHGRVTSDRYHTAVLSRIRPLARGRGAWDRSCARHVRLLGPSGRDTACVSVGSFGRAKEQTP